MAAMVFRSVLFRLSCTLFWSAYVAHSFAAVHQLAKSDKGSYAAPKTLRQLSKEEWNGEVVSNDKEGRIRGCKIQPSQTDSVTEWILTIDGVEADLGRFSDAVYKKILNDAKRQRFQGFRPGTIPPHLEPTYRAFAMDECARETVLEALQQNNIRPFQDTRQDMKLEQFEIPAITRKSQTKKKKIQTNQKSNQIPEKVVMEETDDLVQPESIWRSFATMKEAISAGWKPGQSFSFVATNVRGQRVNTEGSSNLL